MLDSAAGGPYTRSSVAASALPQPRLNYPARAPPPSTPAAAVALRLQAQAGTPDLRGGGALASLGHGLSAAGSEGRRRAWRGTCRARAAGGGDAGGAGRGRGGSVSSRNLRRGLRSSIESGRSWRRAGEGKKEGQEDPLDTPWPEPFRTGPSAPHATPPHALALAGRVNRLNGCLRRLLWRVSETGEGGKRGGRP